MKMLSLPKKYDFKEIENKITEFWLKKKIEEKTLKEDSKKPMFSFLEGPPTANAPPGFHHMEARVYKDLRCRFKFMKGFSVPRKGGWDCHGLPVEVQVEKKLKLRSKKDIENYGIEKFVKTCKEDVFTFIEEWKKFTKRLAYWVDLENPYITMDDNYIECVWWALKKLHDEDLLYQGYRVSPFCTRCSTTLSGHELSDSYQDITETSITVKFKLEDGTNVLAWTTTPWTIPSNLGLAVNPKITYVVVEDNNEKFLLAKEKVKDYFENPNITKEIKGEELVGKSYSPPFDYFKDKLDKPAWKIIPADYVTTEDGTGIVHQAPAFGEEDYKETQKHGLAFVNPIDEHGLFTDKIPELKGKHVLKVDKEIIKSLEENNSLFEKKDNTHSYPFCWRCGTKLIYYSTESWFVKESQFRKQLVDNNLKITWAPPALKEGRFGKWLENIGDWNLSRSRYWGTPLPIWKCNSCKKTKAIGSVKELKDNKIEVEELHRPYVDKIVLKCECGEDMKREPFVIDCWFDSGSATFAQFHYPFENKEKFESNFPYDYICEAIDQTRGWFHSLHAVNNLVFGKNGYKSVLSAGHLVDDKGNKMSKSKGNVLNPTDTFDQVGTDAIRIFLCSSAPESTKRVSVQMIREHAFSTLITLWNTATFIENVKKPKVKDLQEIDKILLYSLNNLVKEVEDGIENFKYHILLKINEFIVEEISRWYIKVNKERLIEKDETAIYTLITSIETVVKLLAPFTPYISEAIYQRLEGKNESVHLEEWPIHDNKEVEKITNNKIKDLETLEELTYDFKDLISIIQKERNLTLKRGVRFPIKKVEVNIDKEKLKDKSYSFSQILENNWLLDIVKKETNVKELVIEEKSSKGTEFSIGTLNIDEEITADMELEGLMREITRKIQDQRKSKGLQRETVITVSIKTEGKLQKTIEKFTEEIKKIVGAKEILLNPGESLKGEEATIKEESITIEIKEI